MENGTHRDAVLSSRVPAASVEALAVAAGMLAKHLLAQPDIAPCVSSWPRPLCRALKPVAQLRRVLQLCCQWRWAETCLKRGAELQACSVMAHLNHGLLS